ncbi:MAG: RidA family protein [Anderseniella sp.]|jgi:enamine deaminase RidA (YjgF/YER057c/UK114 family)|nr:RidA family protein [Anderseniella sp.]
MQPDTTPKFEALSEFATPEERLAALGIELPPVPGAVGDYAPWVITGNLLMTSGQLPWIDGDMKFVGKVGSDLTVEQGYQSFRLSALNVIAQLKSAVGSLSRIRRIVRLEGSINCAPGFTDQASALNGASHMINQAFGKKGLHTRMIYSDPDMVLTCATLVSVYAEV